MRFPLTLALILLCWHAVGSAALIVSLTKQVLVDQFKYPATSTKLDLAGKSIYKIEDNTFADYKDAVDLNLSDNELYELKPGVFAGLVKLKVLLLSGNALVNIPAGVFTGMPELETIDLTGSYFISNDFTFTLAEGAFKDLPKLTRIDLSLKKLKLLNANAFVNTPNMQQLNFYGNLELAEVNLKELNKVLPNLNTLSLYDNKLPGSVINSFDDKMLNLVKLDLDRNALGSLKANVLAGFPKLQTFLAQKNGIASLSSSTFSSHDAIRSIELGENKIAKIDDKAFDGLDKLTFLGLSSNQIESLKPAMFVNLKSLESLELNANKLKEYPKDTLAQFKNLVSLDLSNNQMPSFLDTGIFAGTPNLNSLKLNDVNMSKVDIRLFNDEARCFKTLEMSKNPITSCRKWENVLVPVRCLSSSSSSRPKQAIVACLPACLLYTALSLSIFMARMAAKEISNWFLATSLVISILSPGKLR